MSRDDLNEIPSFTANRDEAVSSAPRGAIPPRAPRSQAVMGLTARLVLTLALAVAGIACGWAWKLKTALDESQRQQKATQGRVADLEALLSDTDETVNKSAASMGAQLRLLDTEVRKLWDARKISNGKLTRLEKGAVTQEKQITGLNTKAAAQAGTRNYARLGFQASPWSGQVLECHFASQRCLHEFRFAASRGYC